MEETRHSSLIILSPFIITRHLALNFQWNNSDLSKAKGSGEDSSATRGLVSNLPHPRVNQTKKHTHSSIVTGYTRILSIITCHFPLSTTFLFDITTFLEELSYQRIPLTSRTTSIQNRHVRVCACAWVEGVLCRTERFYVCLCVCVCASMCLCLCLCLCLCQSVSVSVSASVSISVSVSPYVRMASPSPTRKTLWQLHCLQP